MLVLRFHQVAAIETWSLKLFVIAFSCALERDVLWHGKIYYTSNYLCFFGKIFGKGARVMVNFKDVVAIEKKTTAGVFPNALRVMTLNSKVLQPPSFKKHPVFLS
jgi:hypothetical protein